MKYIDIVDSEGFNKKISYADFVNTEARNYPFETVLDVADKHEEIRLALYHQLLYRARVPYWNAMLYTSKHFKELKEDILKGNNKLDKIFLIVYYYNDLMYKIYNNENDLIKDIEESKDNIYGTDKVLLMLDAYKVFNLIDYDRVNDNINKFINEQANEFYQILCKTKIISDDVFYKSMNLMKYGYYNELNRIKEEKDSQKLMIN